MPKENGKSSISISPIGGNNFVMLFDRKGGSYRRAVDLKYKQFEAMKKESVGDKSPLLYNQIPVVVSPEGKRMRRQLHACNCLVMYFPT